MSYKHFVRYFLTCLWNTWTYFNETCHSYSLSGPHDIRDVLKVTGSDVKITDNFSNTDGSTFGDVLLSNTLL